MSHSSISPSEPASGTPPASLGAGAWWSGVLQAQLGLLGRLSLLYRHAARESQDARSPAELLAIHVNLQRAFAIDCAAYTMDCMLGASGSPGNGRPDGPSHHRSVGEAVAPVMGAITEPMIEGLQAALFAATLAPSAVLKGRAPQAESSAAPARREVDAQPQARREPGQKQARARARK